MTRPSFPWVPEVPMPSPAATQEHRLQATLLDLLLEPEAGAAFEADAAGFGRERGILPPHDAALNRFKDRLQIYRDAARNDVQDLLEHFFPVTWSLLESAETWEDCTAGFLASRSITSPHFRDIAPAFVGWLSASGWGHDRWPSLLATAHFELLELLVGRWPDSPRPTWLEDQPRPEGRIVLEPATRLVSYGHAVHRATPEEPLAESRPVHLLAHRDRDGDFRILELTESTAALLAKGQEVSVARVVAELGLGDLDESLGLLRDLHGQGAIWGFAPG